MKSGRALEEDLLSAGALVGDTTRARHHLSHAEKVDRILPMKVLLRPRTSPVMGLIIALRKPGRLHFGWMWKSVPDVRAGAGAHLRG